VSDPIAVNITSIDYVQLAGAALAAWLHPVANGSRLAVPFGNNSAIVSRA